MESTGPPRTVIKGSCDPPDGGLGTQLFERAADALKLLSNSSSLSERLGVSLPLQAQLNLMGPKHWSPGGASLSTRKERSGKGNCNDTDSNHLFLACPGPLLSAFRVLSHLFVGRW